MVNNYFRPGPNTPANHYPLAIKAENRGATKAYLSGNLFEGADRFNRDNFLAIDFVRWSKGNYLRTTLADVRVDDQFNLTANRPKTQSAMESYERVLREAGASLARDAADARLVEGVRNRTHRMINSQRDVGGWPTLRSTPPRSDRDRDGMPDQWEVEHDTDPDNAVDGNQDRDRDGYSNLEEYLNDAAS